MTCVRDSRITVVSELKALSDEADRYADEFPTETAIEAWFNSVKETFIRISNSTCLEEIATSYPPEISSVFKQERPNKIAKPDIPESQKAHLHSDKNRVASDKNEDVDGNKTHRSTELEVLSTAISNCEVEIVSSCKKATPKTPSCFPCTPKIKMPFKKCVLQNGAVSSAEKLFTPLMDKTFNKIDEISILHSNQSKVFDAVINSSGVKTRSSLKRKSSVGKDKSNKKLKPNVSRDIPATSCSHAAKVMYPRNAIEKATNFKPTPEVKTKVCCVVLPTLKPKMTPVQPKEKLVLEEIRKKEEKANENRRRVLAERQMKAEENKKKREEKIEKTKQKRIKIEEEKQKLVLEMIKPQASKETAKKPTLKTRVKELIDQNAKENKSISPNKLKKSDSEAEGFKTPAPKASGESSFVNYDMTPIPDSSTYDFSDEEDKHPKKPIPQWAQGVSLKSALVTQHYYPPDTDKIFGRVITTPDLTDIFKLQKKRYKIRTSSAVWNTPPERSLRY